MIHAFIHCYLFARCSYNKERHFIVESDTQVMPLISGDKHRSEIKMISRAELRTYPPPNRKRQAGSARGSK